jgi:hypothetical protein
MRIRLMMQEVKGLEIELCDKGDGQAELLRQMDLAREQARQEAMKGGQE